MAEARPDLPSSAYEATENDRTLVRDMLVGLPAIQARANSNLGITERRYDIRETYLTMWHQESTENYRRRVTEACFTPLFEDLLFGITSKPFSKEVVIRRGATEKITKFCEDIDGSGNNLHVFSQRLFESGITDGLVAVIIDYPKVTRPLTRAEEKAMNLRPYWCRVEAGDLLALYTEMVNGKEKILHARVREQIVRVENYIEKKVERIRVLEPGRFELWEKVAGPAKTANKTSWVMIDSGVVSLNYVPMVVFRAGKSKGPQYVVPPLVNLARMQVELFRQENNLKNVENRTAYPMLSADGQSKPDDNNEMAIGPMAILYGNEGGSWRVLEPQGTSLQHLEGRIENTKTEMRRLGMQPLLPNKSGDIAATTSSIEAAKAHSAVQMWALSLKDCLEEALKITADWIGETSEAEVFVNTDFDVGFMSDTSTNAVLMLYEQKVISRAALIDEMKRRSIITADYDAVEDAQQIKSDAETLMNDLPDITPVDMTEDEPAAPPKSEAQMLLEGLLNGVGQ